MNLGDTIEIKKVQGASFCSETLPVAEPVEREIIPLSHLRTHDYSRLLEEGVSLDEYIRRCETEYLKYAITRCKSTYRAAAALNTSQSAIMRRKRKYNM
jgi:transcriptional regulator with PAS, ATPase and Fis domain